MSRGEIDPTVVAAIDASLPRVDGLRLMTLRFAPDFFSMIFPPNSTVPLASVAFQDCTGTLAETRYALFEYEAHRVYYRESRPEPFTAAFFERFYLDDAALRLYAAGEQVAAAIVAMCEISDSDLACHKKKRASEQAALGAYFRRNPKALLASDVCAIAHSRHWRFTIAYRNRWVHEQPPTVSERGVLYRRGRRWTSSGDGTKRFLAIASGDDPEFSTDQLARHFLAANEELVTLVGTAIGEYVKILERHRIRQTTSGFTMPLFGPHTSG